VKSAILGFVGHGIEDRMTWLIEFSERNTRNFFKDFSSTPFSRNEAGNEQDLNIGKRSWRSDFESLKKQFQRMKIQTIGLTVRNIWNFFFRIFRLYRSRETRLEVKKKHDSSIQKCRYVSLCKVLFLNAQIAFLFHFQSRFWRTVWTKNPEKHYRCSSG